MVIAEFRLDSPALRRALDRAPETTAVYEEVYEEDDSVRFLFWAEGGDLESFEQGLEEDPTVATSLDLVSTQDRRLYRVTSSDLGYDVVTFPVWRRLDLVPLEIEGTCEGWQFRMRFPDRDALADYRDACREKDLGFELDAVYHAQETSDDDGTKLSEPQREILVTAYESGYFEIPRDASLADVASRLDISPQSCSERIRRGVASLTESTLVDDA